MNTRCLSFLGALALVLTACGGNDAVETHSLDLLSADDSSSTTSSNDETSADDTGDDAPNPTTLTPRDWRSCDRAGARDVRCAVVEAPLDDDSSAGPMLHIALQPIAVRHDLPMNPRVAESQSGSEL